jgi:hypothetical protein
MTKLQVLVSLLVWFPVSCFDSHFIFVIMNPFIRIYYSHFRLQYSQVSMIKSVGAHSKFDFLCILIGCRYVCKVIVNNIKIVSSAVRTKCEYFVASCQFSRTQFFRVWLRAPLTLRKFLLTHSLHGAGHYLKR